MESSSIRATSVNSEDDVITELVFLPDVIRIVAMCYRTAVKNTAYIFDMSPSSPHQDETLRDLKARYTEIATTEFRIASRLYLTYCDGAVYVRHLNDDHLVASFGGCPTLTELEEAIDYYNAGQDVEDGRYIRMVHYTKQKSC